MKNYLAIAALTLLVAACGGGSSDSPPVASSTGGGTSSVANAFSDAFTAMVFNIYGTQPDNTEPGSIDALVVTTPENTEPTPII